MEPTMSPQAMLLMAIAEDLRKTDRPSYDALILASQQGCSTLMQIEISREPQLSLGFRDDYGVTKWVHAMPLQ